MCLCTHAQVVFLIVPLQAPVILGSKSFRQPPPPPFYAPSPTPSGLLGPQGPCELPTKVHNAIQTMDQRTKSTFTQVEPSLKAKRHCLDGFQKTPIPSHHHTHPVNTPQKEKKNTAEPHFPPYTHPISQFLSLKKVLTIPMMETWEPNILHQARSHPPVHKHPPNLAKPPLHRTKGL